MRPCKISEELDKHALHLAVYALKVSHEEPNDAGSEKMGRLGDMLGSQVP